MAGPVAGMQLHASTPRQLPKTLLLQNGHKGSEAEEPASSTITAYDAVTTV